MSDLNNFWDWLNWFLGSLIWCFFEFVNLFRTELGRELLINLSAFTFHLVILIKIPPNLLYLIVECIVLFLTVLSIKTFAIERIIRGSLPEIVVYICLVYFVTFIAFVFKNFPLQFNKKGAQKQNTGSK